MHNQMILQKILITQPTANSFWKKNLPSNHEKKIKNWPTLVNAIEPQASDLWRMLNSQVALVFTSIRQVNI